MTAASAVIRQTTKSGPLATARPDGAARLLTVKVNVPPPSPRAASVAPVIASTMVPAASPDAQALRIQREGAYINAVLRAQDEARRSQQFAARNREYSAALQQRMQEAAQAHSRNRFTYSVPTVPRSSPVPSNPAPLEQALTGETVVVPL